MNTKSSRYLVQRRRTEQAGWSRVAACGSLDYARALATVGIRRRIGVAYRVIHKQSGTQINLAP